MGLDCDQWRVRGSTAHNFPGRVRRERGVLFHTFPRLNFGMTGAASAATSDHKVDDTRWEQRGGEGRGLELRTSENPSLCLPWTSVMRKRNGARSGLSHCCFGFFFPHSHSEP